MKNHYTFLMIILSFGIFVLTLSSLWAAPTKKMQSSLDQFNQQFKPLKELILDEKSYFSFSKMIADLDRVKPLAEKIGKHSVELCEWFAMYTLVLSKKTESHSRELIEAANEYLALLKKSPCKTTDEKLARLYYRLSHAYEYEGNLSKAIESQKSFIPLGEKADLLSSASTLLGQKQRLAYLLAENKEPSKALKINLSIEKEAKKSRIPEKDLVTLFNNIAQNYYDIGNFVNTKTYLDKRLLISKKYKNFEVEQNTLFQLAVLAFEQGKFKLSKKLFTQRLQLAKEKKDELEYTSIDDIEEDLRIYAKKIKKVKK
jgi:tetratricopeptide (TPR) repeat protein